MLDEKDRIKYLKRAKTRKGNILDTVIKLCDRKSRCPYCQGLNGFIKEQKGEPLRIVYDRSKMN